MTTRVEPELVALRRSAEELAKGKLSTGHLLAAIARTEGGAADLLKERRLDADVLLKAARVVVDDAPDAVARVVQRAREFAARSPSRQPGPLHLLFALCNERTTAAYRAIEQCGTDVAKLRVAAMQLAMGLVEPRRGTVRPAGPSAARTLATHASRGTTVARRGVPPTPAPSLPPPTASPPQPPPPQRARRLRQPAPREVGDPAVRFALDPKRFPTLHALGRNLTLAAARGELDPVVGRDAQIEQALDVLAKRHANNPCLVGAAGVGKTSVVRGIALRIASGQDVSSLDDRILVEIDVTALLAGTGVRGALAERIAQIKGEVKRAEGRVVVFFDEIHTLFGGDAGDEAAGELKVALARGELPCIGATTYDEYRRVIEADPALARRFSRIEVPELSPAEAIAALTRVAPLFEKYHGARFAADALAASVEWSARYMPDRALPDKAVGILDLAGARARRRRAPEVTREGVAEVVSEIAGVPVERLLETDAARLLRLEELLAERIVGHSDALARIATVLRRNASGFRSHRPIGSFLLLGPTGVGKTETAKAIAECLFHSPHALTRLDLSEYAEAHAIARLVGAPPGYVGYEAGGQLTEAVRKRPYGVVLLDEVEKAHRDVLEAFLQVFDEGRLTDGRGRTVDFTNTVILLTSNLGVEAASQRVAEGRRRIGFGARSKGDEAEGAEYTETLVAAARGALPPELYNRLDEVLAFAPLRRADVAEVARRLLAKLDQELRKARGVSIDASQAAIEALLDAGGFDPELGARPMRRAIARFVEAPIAEMILRGQLTRGDVALVEAERGTIVVDVVRGG